jgi:hypothetical protein
MSTEPTNEELSASFARQVDGARKAREQQVQKRLGRDGRSAAAMDEAERKDENAQVVAGQKPAERDAKEETPDARKQRLLEAFREKSGRDRQAELEKGR